MDRTVSLPAAGISGLVAEAHRLSDGLTAHFASGSAVD
jgi:hypothetical protein